MADIYQKVKQKTKKINMLFTFILFFLKMLYPKIKPYTLSYDFKFIKPTNFSSTSQQVYCSTLLTQLNL